jgi:hypothetical protein
VINKTLTTIEELCRDLLLPCRVLCSFLFLGLSGRD